MTKPVHAIQFSDKEYAKALKKHLERELDSIIEKSKNSFDSRGIVSLSKSDVGVFALTYTSENAVKNYFIYAADVDETPPEEAAHLKNLLGARFLGGWPTTEQIELIAKNSYGSKAFISSENERGICTVSYAGDDGTWHREDFIGTAYPVSVRNFEEKDLKDVIISLFKDGYVPYFGSDDDRKTGRVADLIEKLGSTFKLNPEGIKDIKLPPEIDQEIKAELLKSLQLTPDFTAEDVKNYLKKSDFLRAEIPIYDDGFFSDETQWLWELWPDENDENSGHNVEISGDIVIRTHDPRDDVKKDSVIAVDFGTSATVVVEYDPSHPDEPRQICVGNPENNDFENPTLMSVKKLGDFLASYYAKDCRPYTKWEDLMAAHAVKERMGDLSNDEFKSVVSHIKQWAADAHSKLTIKPAAESEPITIKSLPALMGDDDSEDFNPIEIYAYFLGLYLNNRHFGHGIFLNYKLSHPATPEYNKEIQDYICKSFKKGIRKSIPAAIKDEEIIVEMNISEPEAYAITAMNEYALEPEDDEKIKFAIFDFGGGTSDFAYGYWSGADKEAKGKERKIETVHTDGEQYLGGENILDGLAFEVFSDPRNLKTMGEQRCKFYYGIEKFQKGKGIDDRYLSNNFYAKNNMATLIDWNGESSDEYFSKGLREFWEHQEDYFGEYFSIFEKSNSMKILINEISSLLKRLKPEAEETKSELEKLLKKANETDNEIDRKSIATSLAVLESDHKTDFAASSQDDYTLSLTLYSQTDDSCEPVSNVDIIVSKKLMYEYISEQIERGIDSFFTALKTAFKNDYTGSIKIFLAGNSSKSKIFENLMEERIRKESNENVKFDLFKRFDSDDYARKLEEVAKAQGWDDETIEEIIREKTINREAKFRPTGKTGVAFGIIEELKGKIQVENKVKEIFKFYLGDSKRQMGLNRFVLLDSLGAEKLSDWIPAFELQATSSQDFRKLYYTRSAKCVDGKLLIKDVKSVDLKFDSSEEGDKLFIKAAGVDKIYYAVAKNAEEAEEKIKKSPTDNFVTLVD